MHKLVMVSSVFLGLTAIPSYADRVTIGGLRFQPQILCATTSENAAGGCRSERGLPRVGPEGAPPVFVASNIDTNIGNHRTNFGPGSSGDNSFRAPGPAASLDDPGFRFQGDGQHDPDSFKLRDVSVDPVPPVAAVPEPNSLAFLSILAFGFLGLLRRRTKVNPS